MTDKRTTQQLWQDTNIIIQTSDAVDEPTGYTIILIIIICTFLNHQKLLKKKWIPDNTFTLTETKSEAKIQDS